MSAGGREETRAAAQPKKHVFHALPDSEIYTSGLDSTHGQNQGMQQAHDHPKSLPIEGSNDNIGDDLLAVQWASILMNGLRGNREGRNLFERSGMR